MRTIFLELLAGGLVAGLLYAIWTDWRERVIPNPLNAAIALSAPLWWWASGISPWPGVAIQLAVGIVALLVFMVAFAIGAMGGGDVKLIAALGLWLVPLDFMQMIVWMSIGGGLLTVVMLIAHRARKAEGPLEIPYGIAIAAATIPEFTQRYLYHFGR